MGRRVPELTRGRAPQDGGTPLFMAAHQGHVAVVELLVAKGADMDAANKVWERRGGDVGRSRGVCFFLGVGARLLSVSAHTRIGGYVRPCTVFVAPTW